jgi:uncharacterized protein with NAD-binding domain and iron-sulfur cluster
MAAAFELSRPQHGYDVTVFQQGWRLGGKGASGRGRDGRIEEHGLHVWMGYYENAFRLMRECYDELGRDPREAPIATWRDAFSPASRVAAADMTSAGAWAPWVVDFDQNSALPGELDESYRPPSVTDYLARTIELLRRLISTTLLPGGGASGGSPAGPAAARRRPLPAGVIDLGVLTGLGGLLEVLRQIEVLLEQVAAAPGGQIALEIARVVDAVVPATRSLLDSYVRDKDHLRRLWGVADVALATVRGAMRAGLGAHPRGFDVIDGHDCREWLKQNGASDLSINSSFVRALYDLGFAFEDGDPQRPRIAAGAGLRGSWRAFFTYRGAFFWKMAAGMGDVVFAPLYEVLRRRGVRFDFFHRLAHVRLGGGRPHPFVAALDFDVQARVRGGGAYAPLVDVGGLPCWPSEPDWSQLAGGDQLRAAGRDFESHTDARRAERRTLEVGRDFDFVVLAVGVGALPSVGKELIARDERWRAMVDTTKTVATRAFQLWMKPAMRDLGWPGDPVSLTGFSEPFDTWADMSHLSRSEGVRPEPGAIAYFCSVLPDGQAAAGDPSAGVKRDAVAFLNQHIGQLWPNAVAGGGGFRWDMLHDFGVGGGRGGAAPAGEARFDTQFWRANVSPSDRYTLSLPGSLDLRLSPLAIDVQNLTVAGDWTASGLNLGCVEGAVMSGLLAAHAVCQAPSLSRIVGFDHP